ncbi:angiotensin-converting enzyme-like protein Ace3, partial [Halyomorpha halys]|uniref:angiotensin-converting enzyme-like protein Ace3 n=1 Tax=Halyomorpha halys TaxID=286706 RepID=UPI0006D4EB13
NFVSTVLQFQIHRSLCLAARRQAHTNPADPIHKCDIYRSSAAGDLLARIMAAGSSIPWQRLLYETTGEGKLDGRALRDFFAPLEDWLKNENLRTGEKVEWLYDGDYCKYSIETANLQVQGGYYSSSNTMHIHFLMFLVLQYYLIFQK